MIKNDRFSWLSMLCTLLLATAASAKIIKDSIRSDDASPFIQNDIFIDQDSCREHAEVNVDPEGYTLVHVAILSRHSIRAPAVVDNRLLKESQFPLGLGYSTRIGNQFSLKVGKIWRKFYKRFIENTTVRQIWARSSGYVRCIETQQLVLSQMFPPEGEFDFGHPIQPIAITRVPEENDVNVENCGALAPKSLWYLNNLKDRALTDDGFENFGEFVDYVTSNSGYRANETEYFEPVIDGLYCARYNQLPLPDWAEAKWTSIDFAMRKLSFDYWINDIPYYGNYIGKFLADRLRGAAHGKYPEKFSLFSYHDTSIQALFKAMGNDPSELYPSFLAALHFQLYKRKCNGEFYVRVMYHQGSTEELDYRHAREIVLARCPFPNCPLKDLVEKLSHMYDDVDRQQCSRIDLNALL